MTQIKTIKIAGIQDGPHLLISAGVHGDEYEPMEVCRELAIYLKERKELLRGRVTLVPVVNEPAFRLASRKGPDGKDLARICPGDRDGSISEVIAAEFSDLIRTADYFIDMHNGGHMYGIMPFSGYVLHEDLAVRELQKAMAFACNLPVVWATDATLDGRSLSIARDANVPAIYTETGGSSVYDPQITKLLLNSCLNVLHLLKMLDAEVTEPEIQHFLEDFRKHSGHLQRLLPSPATGFFVPDCALADYITEGEVVGHVKDPRGEHVVPVVAGETGILTVLRNIPSVEEGESLGAILPVTRGEQSKTMYD